MAQVKEDPNQCLSCGHRHYTDKDLGCRFPPCKCEDFREIPPGVTSIAAWRVAHKKEVKPKKFTFWRRGPGGEAA